jgi:NitT/TauT family transport system permease protein
MNRSRAVQDPVTLIAGGAIVAATLLVWEIWADSSVTVRLLLSSPLRTCAYAANHFGDAAQAFLYTGLESLVGLLVATIFALGFGVVCIYYPRVGNISFPLLVASQVIPLVCLAPMIILVFGPGPSGKVFLSALIAFFPILTNVISGIRSVPSASQEMMRIMAASKAHVIRHVIIPHCSDHFFAGMRIAAPLAVIGAIVAEFNGADVGIGKDIFISAKRLEPELMMGGIVAGAILSGLIYGAVLLLERRLGSWYWER